MVQRASSPPSRGDWDAVQSWTLASELRRRVCDIDFICAMYFMVSGDQ